MMSEKYKDNEGNESFSSADIYKDLANKHERVVESSFGKVNVKEFSPENPESQVPVFILPGWSENPEVLEGSMDVFYKNDRRVFSFDHPRGAGEPEPTSEELRKALTVLELIESQGLGRVDAVAHSEGAINVLIAASLRPEYFRNIVMMAPAGLIGKDSFINTIGRFSVKNVRNVFRAFLGQEPVAPTIKGLVEGAKYIAKNPRRAVREIKEISQTEIQDTIKDLSSNADIKFALLQSQSDVGFPPERIAENVDINDVTYASLSRKEAGHDEFYIRPQKGAMASLQMIQQLEQTHP